MKINDEVYEDFKMSISGCCDPKIYLRETINGICEECGCPTVDGEAFVSCDYSPKACDICGWAPCDGSC